MEGSSFSGANAIEMQRKTMMKYTVMLVPRLVYPIAAFPLAEM